MWKAFAKIYLTFLELGGLGVSMPQSLSVFPPPRAFRRRCVAAFSSIFTKCPSSAAAVLEYAKIAWVLVSVAVLRWPMDAGGAARLGSLTAFDGSCFSSHLPTRLTACWLVI